MFADMERVKKFVPTLKEVIKKEGLEFALDSMEDMIANGGYSSISELQQGLECDLEEYEE